VEILAHALNNERLQWSCLHQYSLFVMANFSGWSCLACLWYHFPLLPLMHAHPKGQVSGEGWIQSITEEEEEEQRQKERRTAGEV